MKHLIVPFIVLLVLGCKKEDIPVPLKEDAKATRGITVLSTATRNGVLTQQHFFSEGRRTYSIISGNRINYLYNDAERTTTVEQGTRYIYKFDEKFKPLYMDVYYGSTHRYHHQYYYEHTAMVMMKNTFMWDPASSVEVHYDFTGPWQYVITDYVIYPGYSDHEVYAMATWKTPYLEEWMDTIRNTRFTRQYSQQIKAPDFNLRAVPIPARIQDPKNRELLFDWTEIPADREPDLLLLKTQYYENGILKYTIRLEDIKLNADGLPLEYTEVVNTGGNTTRNRFSFTYISI